MILDFIIVLALIMILGTVVVGVVILAGTLYFEIGARYHKWRIDRYSRKRGGYIHRIK